METSWLDTETGPRWMAQRWEKKSFFSPGKVRTASFWTCLGQSLQVLTSQIYRGPLNGLTVPPSSPAHAQLVRNCTQLCYLFIIHFSFQRKLFFSFKFGPVQCTCTKPNRDGLQLGKRDYFSESSSSRHKIDCTFSDIQPWTFCCCFSWTWGPARERQAAPVVLGKGAVAPWTRWPHFTHTLSAQPVSVLLESNRGVLCSVGWSTRLPAKIVNHDVRTG